MKRQSALQKIIQVEVGPGFWCELLEHRRNWKPLFHCGNSSILWSLWWNTMDRLEAAVFI